MENNNIYPILEFDPDKKAIIEPKEIYKTNKEMPKACIICFYLDTVKKMAKIHKAVPVYTIQGQGEPIIIYQMTYREMPVLFVFPGIGAPMAGAVLDICIALGVDKVIACGSAGVLYSDIIRDKIIILDSAVRDEGMSYHYLPPSVDINADYKIVSIMEDVLKEKKLDYIKGKTWTTDAFFRETKSKIEKRKKQGCIIVEMEAASMMAIARFRNISFGQIIGASDDISKDEWDRRDGQKKQNFKEILFFSAMDIIYRLNKKTINDKKGK